MSAVGNSSSNPFPFTGLSGVGSAVSDMFAGIGEGYQAQGEAFEEQNYKEAAQLALQNEQYTKTSTAIKQQQADQQLYQSLGKTTAATAGAGFAASGSSLDILRTSAQEGATTRAVIGQQGLITEAGYAEQAQSYENLASAAQVAINADKEGEIGDFISGGISAAGNIPGIVTGLSAIAAMV